MCNLKNEQQMNKQSRCRLTDSKNKPVVARGQGFGEVDKIGEGD